MKQNNTKPNSLQLFTLWDTEGGAWKPHKDPKEFMEYISPANEADNPKPASVERKELPFYKDADMIRIHDKESDGFCFFIAYGDNELVMLDGSRDQILEVNASGALDLTADNVFDYMKFFCYFTHGNEEEGPETGEPFYFIEGPQSEFISGDSQYMKDRIVKGYSGPRVLGEVGSGSFLVDARLLYQGAAFDSKFKISPDGDVEMTDDEAVSAL
jgi:hypothetical protein